MRRALWSLLVAGALAFAIGASPTPRVPALRPACPPGKHVRAATAGPTGTLGKGAWSWFADPRAVRLDRPYEETVVGWIDWRGNVTVAALDVRCHIEQRAVVGHLFHDDHGAPAVLVEPSGQLTVFWSGHNGPEMYYRTTLRPGDVSAWGPRRQVRSRIGGGLGFTYPNPVLLGSKLYLFWRGANWGADYAARTVAGRWSLARQVIVNPGQRPYLKVAANGRDTIGLAFTDGHPRNLITSVYYAGYRGGWLRHASGRPIARLGAYPIAPRQADVVYDGSKSHVPSWVWDVALDRHSRPVIVYATFPSATNHRYWYARWSGRRWVSRSLAFAGPTISPGTIEGEYSGGITLDHADPSILYMSRKVRGSYEIERWSTRDGGYHWDRQVVVRTGGFGDIRPVVPRGRGQAQIRLMWLQGHYGTYSGYRTRVGYLR